MTKFNPFERERLDGLDPDGFQLHRIDAGTGDDDDELAPPEAQEAVSRIVTLLMRRALEDHDERPLQHYMTALSDTEAESLDPEILMAALELTIITLAKTMRKMAIDLSSTDAMIVRRDANGQVNLIMGDHVPASLRLTPGDPANA